MLTRLRRCVFGAYLVLGGGTSVVLPLAEARAEALSATATSHVEEKADRACVPVHEHWSCTVCRALRLVARRESTPTFLLLESAPVAPRLEVLGGFAEPDFRALHPSRAPPSA